MTTTWQAAKKRRCDCPKKNKVVLEQIRQELRIVQNISGCATTTLNLILKRLQPFLKGCENFKAAHLHVGEWRKESPLKLRLHGCVGCDKHVFGPSDVESECPQCGHPRFDEQGNPHEVFPLFTCLSIYLLITSFTHCRYAGTFRFESS